MKKLGLFLLSLALCLSIVACHGPSSEARAQRSKPRVMVSSLTVMLFQAPGPNANIGPDGTLKIDDIVLPLSADQKAKLQTLFGRLQIMRQNAVTEAKPDSAKRPIPLQADPQLTQLEQDILQTIEPMKAYKNSFNLLLAEQH